MELTKKEEEVFLIQDLRLVVEAVEVELHDDHVTANMMKVTTT
jgi:hypothetical protein